MIMDPLQEKKFVFKRCVMYEIKTKIIKRCYQYYSLLRIMSLFC